MKATVTISLAILAFIVLGSLAGDETAAKISWMTFEEAVEKAKKKDKPIFIDVYTNWCGWCKVMDQNTFTQAEIITKMNRDFYAVKFNAEQREPVNFQGKEFKFVASGNRGYHELAATLLSGRLAYPTVVFLVDKSAKAYPHAGYQRPENLTKLMDYYAGGFHNKVDFNTWMLQLQID